MAETYFVAGTDTEVGKTFATCALLHCARAAGRTALALKPVAAGATQIEGRRINDDAAALRAGGSFDPGLDLLNPYCLSAAVAPHIAAAQEGTVIERERILAARDRLAAQAELLFIEGVGGFRVPLRSGYDTADLAVDLAAPILLVVGLRLGCINHALLSAEAIAARGLELAGWIANSIDPGMLCRDENLDALRERIDAPLLGVLPFEPAGRPDRLAPHLTLPAPCHPGGNTILVVDSAAELGLAHRGRVVITGSHGGTSAAAYAARARPALVFFNDAGGGKQGAGFAGLSDLQQAGIAAACYAHDSACIGNGWDAFGNGRVSHANRLGEALGVRIGDPVVAAATAAANQIQGIKGASDAEKSAG